MTGKKYSTIGVVYRVRGPAGVVVVLTAEEYRLYLEGSQKEHEVRRRKATFLPGVNAEYDARFERRAEQAMRSLLNRM
jgi:hypothetical protein